MRTGFDIGRLIEMYSPELLRKPKHLAWLQTCAKPLKTAWAGFLLFRKEKLYEAAITGETNRLERALRDRYGDNGIYILHPTDYLDTAWIWTKTEPVFPEHDFLMDETPPEWEHDFLADEYDPEHDFVVRVPAALAGKTEEMRAWLKRYVMAGKRYKIELY